MRYRIHILLLLSAFQLFSLSAFSRNIRIIAASPPSVTYSNIMLDYFTTAEASTLATPRIAEPGPGGWTLTQTDGELVITNQMYQWETNVFPGTQLRYTAQSTAVIGDLKLISTNSLATNAGLCFLAKVRVTAGSSDIHIGFERTSVASYPDAASVRFSALTTGLAGRYNGNVIGAWPSFNLNCDYEIAIILRPGGGSYTFFRGGEIAAGSTDKVKSFGFPDWRLLWVDDLFKDQTVYPDIDVMAADGFVDTVRIMKLDEAQWLTQFGYATNRTAVTVANDTLYMPWDATVEHTFTAETGVTTEMKVRAVDANNYFLIRNNQGASTIKLIEVNAGVETERQTAAKTWVNGTSYRISAVCYHSNIFTYIATDFAFSGGYAAAPYSKDAVATAAVSHAGSNFNVWPMRPTLTLGPVVPTRKILCFGDSKTQGAFDLAAPSGAYTGYPRYLADGLNTNGTLTFNVGRASLNSATVQQLKDNVDSYISKIPDAQEFVLVNMGANDYTLTNANSTFTNNAGYIVDAFHTAWPSAKVYVMQFWAEAHTATHTNNVNSIRACLAGIVAARSSWCFNGPDEFVFLEGGDAGATYMTDDVHPNHAGYLLTAIKWREVLGL